MDDYAVLTLRIVAAQCMSCASGIVSSSEQWLLCQSDSYGVALGGGVPKKLGSISVAPPFYVSNAKPYSIFRSGGVRK